MIRALGGAFSTRIVEFISFHTIHGRLSEKPNVFRLDLVRTVSATPGPKGAVTGCREAEMVFWARVIVEPRQVR